MMKKGMIIFVLILSVFLSGCFDIQLGNSLKGNWTVTGYVDYINREDTSYVRSDLYDPDVDQYYSAMIISMTDSLVISNDNGRDSWYCDTLWSYTYTEDSLYFADLGYPEYSIKVEYYFPDRTHLVWRVSYDSSYTTEIHLKKYKGALPPDTWITDVEDDEYEPDGDIESATSIRLNSRQSHTLTVNDSDYYRIQATEGKSYLIQGLGYFNFELYLYDQNGNSLTHDYHNSLRIKDLGEEVRSVMLWTCEESNDYYPMAKCRYSLSGSGYYQMLVSEVDTHDIEYEEPYELDFIYECKTGIDIINKMINR